MTGVIQAGEKNSGVWHKDPIPVEKLYALNPLLSETVAWSLSSIDTDAPYYICDAGAGNLHDTIEIARMIALGRSGQVVLLGVDIQDSAVNAMLKTIVRMDIPQNLVIKPLEADITKGLDDISPYESQHLVILHNVTPWLQTEEALYSSLQSLRRIMMRGASIHIKAPTQWNRSARPFPVMTNEDLFVRVSEEEERKPNQMVTIYGWTYGRDMLFCPQEAMAYALRNTGFTLMDATSVRNNLFPNGYGDGKYCRHHENVNYFAVAC